MVNKDTNSYVTVEVREAIEHKKYIIKRVMKR